MILITLESLGGKSKLTIIRVCTQGREGHELTNHPSRETISASVWTQRLAAVHTELELYKAKDATREKVVKMSWKVVSDGRAIVGA